MTCPYAVTRITTIHNVYHFTEEGYNDSSDTIEKNAAVFVECQKTRCGAWKDGKCCYKGE